VTSTFILHQLKKKLSQVLVIMPVILATEEAPIRRTGVRSQPGERVRKTLPQKRKNHHKKGLVEQLKV
jgi:hypothetical protein